MRTEKIILGRLGDVYGIKGWLHLFSFTHPPDNIFQYSNWQIRAHQKRDTSWQTVTLEAHKPHGNAFVVKFKNCDDRDTALLLKNHTIAIERTDLPPLQHNQYYWDDLIGLQVINTHGESLGTIDYLFATGANDVIALKGHKIMYIPYIQSVIKSVDLETRIMIVEWDAQQDDNTPSGC